MPAVRTVLLADANVLIDYREAGWSALELVGRHVGRIVVIPSVLDEVHGVTAEACAELGIEVVIVQTERMLQAAAIKSSVSFNDRLCLVTCRAEGWTCVTNDAALRRLCEHHGVKTRYGLGLLIDLVAGGWVTRERAEEIARRMQASNPLHINERIIGRFRAALDRCAQAP